MRRRTFFWSVAGIGATVAGLGAFVSTRSFESTVEKKILDELGFLKLDLNGVRQFVADYSKPMTHRNKILLERYSLLGITSSQSKKIRRMLNAYLLSTDFFMRNMDESRTINYVALHDPQLRPCVNPFSNVFYPQENS